MFRNPNHHYMSKNYCNAPQTCSIARHLHFALQCTSNLYCGTRCPWPSGRKTLVVLLPFASQYTSHRCRNSPPIHITMLGVEKSWWLGSPGCSPESLVSHYSAIGDTTSCDSPCSAIGLRGISFSPIAFFQGLSLDCDRPFLRKEVGAQQR